MCHMCHCSTNAPFRNLHYLLSSITTYPARKRQHHRTNSSPCPWKCYAKTKFLYLIQAELPPRTIHELPGPIRRIVGASRKRMRWVDPCGRPSAVHSTPISLFEMYCPLWSPWSV